MRFRLGFVLWIAVAAAGCYWIRYYDLLETHVELMQGMANDAAEAVEAGIYRPRASEVERLGYPLSRARQFSTISADWAGVRISHAAFAGFVAAYAAFVESVDAARADGIDAGERREMLKKVHRVDVEAAIVRDCVVCEREEREAACRRCPPARRK